MVIDFNKPNGVEDEDYMMELFLLIEDDEDSIIMSFMHEYDDLLIEVKIRLMYKIKLVLYYYYEHFFYYHKNPSDFNNIYIISNFFSVLDNYENILLKNKLEKRLGRLDGLYSEVFVNIYKSLELLHSHVIKRYIENKQDFLNSIKGQYFDFPEGKVLVQENNHISKYPMMIRTSFFDVKISQEFIYNSNVNVIQSRLLFIVRNNY